jgi:hypothetical protein
MPEDSRIIEVRHGFGLLFMGVSISVILGSILSEIAFVNSAPLYYHIPIWLASFSLPCGAIFGKFPKVISAIQGRMKGSVMWPVKTKAIDGICWAAPFATIPIMPHSYQFLILLGIGLGNFSTYIIIKKYNREDNREQLIVGLISLTSIPVAMSIDITVLAARHDIAVMLSRILISIAYGAGGIYALKH